MKFAEAAQVRSEINVTPLVDVVLVLLIIFMVVTPMLQKGASVKLPVAEEPPKKPEDVSQIMVVIEENKRIWVEKETTTEDDFPRLIQEQFQRNPGSSVVIKGDARLTYGDVKRAMMAVEAAGFRQVGLIAAKRSQTAG
jgi:biopolymer transport protein ExbD